MTQPRFRPRYAIKGQGLEDLYDVVDANDGCIVSDKPTPWDEASADASLRNNPAPTLARPIDNWLCGMNMPPLDEVRAFIKTVHPVKSEAFDEVLAEDVRMLAGGGARRA